MKGNGKGNAESAPHDAPIKFYGMKNSYGFFSNFYEAPIFVNGKVYPTNEHYFQSLKFPSDEKYMETVRLASGPKRAKQLGRTRKVPLREDWEQVKVQIMFDCCLAKFQQHRELTKKMLDTGNAKLVEHTSRDNIWADGGDGSGKNLLGKVLMAVRAAIRGDPVKCEGVTYTPMDANQEDVSPLKNSKEKYKSDPSEQKKLKQAKLSFATILSSTQATTSSSSTATTLATISSSTSATTVATTSTSSTTPTTKNKALEATPSKSRIVLKQGDLLEAEEDFIVHQCNCVSTYAKGLAKVLFKKYPQADIYKSRKGHTVPGTISITGTKVGAPNIINMFAQFSPGQPKSPESSKDSKTCRLQWFDACLKEIEAHGKKSSVGNIKSIAFPFQIGCGLAGGDWNKYKKLLDGFADRNKNTLVVIYKLPSMK
eukprot:m.41038 g.41038  ORF g.41038 m.41038 type:complete len:427 (+) comp6973_c0_seq1:66-1346(+)